VIIRELGAGDDVAALLDLSVRAFGPVPDRSPWEASAATVIADRRYLAAFDGERMIAAARYHDMNQCWAGRWLRMAAVASVAVAPEERGRGTGRALVGALLSHIAARGYPVSVLYPATSPLYRSLGWEIAGSCETLTIPARSLRVLAAPDPDAGPPPAAGPPPDAAADPGGRRLRRCGPADAAAVAAVLSRVHQTLRDSGPNVRDGESIRQWLAAADRFGYLAPDGFLAYRWGRGNDEIQVERAVAVSAATTRAIWGVVASHSPIADRVRARLAPHDPMHWLTREPDVERARREPWMLRLVDAPAAIAERGYPAAAEITAALELADRGCPGNAGRWTLEVSGGKGVLSREPTGPARGAAGRPLRAGPRGLAALYAGTPVATLRRAGLVAGGDPAADAGLDTVFAAQPFLLDTF
jgi:predicted acetyltransferase